MAEPETEETAKKRKLEDESDDVVCTEKEKEDSEPIIVIDDNSPSPPPTPRAIPVVVRDPRDVLKELTYEPPGPKSKKKSAQILKELEVRTILQSAVIISADSNEVLPPKKKFRAAVDNEEPDVDDIGKAEDGATRADLVESEDSEIVVADQFDEVEAEERNGAENSDDNNSEAEVNEEEDNDQEVVDEEQSEQEEQASEAEEVQENDDEGAATENENTDGAENVCNGIPEGSGNESNDEQPPEDTGEEEEGETAAENQSESKRAGSERVYEKPGPRCVKKRPELCEDKPFVRPGPKSTKKNLPLSDEDDNLPIDADSEVDDEENDGNENQEGGEEQANQSDNNSDDDSVTIAEPEPEVVIRATKFTVFPGSDPLNPPRRLSPTSRKRLERRQRQSSSSDSSSGSDSGSESGSDSSDSSGSSTSTSSTTDTTDTSSDSGSGSGSGSRSSATSSDDYDAPVRNTNKPSHNYGGYNYYPYGYNRNQMRKDKKDIPNSVFFDMRVPLNQLINDSDSDDGRVDYFQMNRDSSNYKYRKKFEMNRRPQPMPPRKRSKGERMLDRMKYYLKLAGMKKTNFDTLFRGCSTFEQQCNRIVQLLKSEGLEGDEPNEKNCRKLRILRQMRRETAELDTSLIIQTEGRSTRRSARLAKPQTTSITAEGADKEPETTTSGAENTNTTDETGAKSDIPVAGAGDAAATTPAESSEQPATAQIEGEGLEATPAIPEPNSPAIETTRAPEPEPNVYQPPPVDLPHNMVPQQHSVQQYQQAPVQSVPPEMANMYSAPPIPPPIAHDMPMYPGTLPPPQHMASMYAPPDAGMSIYQSHHNQMQNMAIYHQMAPPPPAAHNLSNNNNNNNGGQGMDDTLNRMQTVIDHESGVRNG